MRLTRGQVVGYDVTRMTFKFTMLNKDEVVECAISAAAMDDLSGARGVRPDAREEQFLSLRTEIERLASDRFDIESKVQGRIVRVFAKHVGDRLKR